MKRKHGSKGILLWFLKENAHREIMIRGVKFTTNKKEIDF